MRKYDESFHEDSCWNKAKTNEMMFILLARDAAAPATIRFWISERIRVGKNQAGDPQVEEAEQCAKLMEIDQNCASDGE